MSDERREHARIEVPRVLVRVATEDRMRSAYLKDLSQGGMFIRTDRPLAIGKKLLVQLLAPGRSEVLALPGAVVRQIAAADSTAEHPAGMGVKFDELDAAASTALNALLKEYEQGVESSLPSDQELMLQLRVSSDRIASLTQELQNRELEVLEERSRRLESGNRLVEVVGELETLRARNQPADAASSAAAAGLTAELASARTELDAVRSDLALTKTNLAALAEELTVLEQDDFTTRRFAEKLGRERQTLQVEVDRLKTQLSATTKELEALRSDSAARHTTASDRAERAERGLDEAKGRATAAEAALETERIERSRAQGRAAELEPTRAELTKVQASFAEAERKLAVEKQALAQAKAELEDTRAKLAGSKKKERELRELMALAARPADEVVQELPPAEAAPTAAVAAAPEKKSDDWGAAVQPSTPDVDVDLES